MASTAPPSPLPPDIQLSTGPLLLGYVFNWGLLGSLIVQVYLYYSSFPNDRLAIKTLVYGLFTLEILQTVLLTHDLFHAYAIGWGDLDALNTDQLVWLACPILGGIVSCIVQLFFAFRISILSKSKWTGAAIATIAVVQGTAGVVQGIQAKIVSTFSNLQSKAFVSCVSKIWLAGSALCDVIIAICMSYYLYRKNSAFKSTRVIINRLIRLTIETGSLTAAIAIAGVIVFSGFPNKSFFTAPPLVLTKLYTNNLVLIFNSRIRIVGGRDSSQSEELLELQTSKFLASTPAAKISNRGTSVPVRLDPCGERLEINVSTDMWSETGTQKFKMESTRGDASTDV